MVRFDLTDAECAIITPLLPDKPRGVARVDGRRVLNGIFYILSTGSPWRDLPGRYGPYTTVYNRFNRWARAGVRQGLRRPNAAIVGVDGVHRQPGHTRPPACGARKKRGVRRTPSVSLAVD